MERVVQLFTPGLDSYLGNFMLNKMLRRGKIKELKRVYFNLNSVYSEHEINFFKVRYLHDASSTDLDLQRIVTIVNDVFDFSEIEDKQTLYVPNRNLMLVTMAASMFPDADTILINGMKDDRVSDNRRSLFEFYSEILSNSLQREVKIDSLFWDKEKGEVISDYLLSGGIKFDLMTETYSCFSNHFKIRNEPVSEINHDGTFTKLGNYFLLYGCLECPACFRRLCALTEANIYVPFKNTKLAFSYKQGVDKEVHPVRFRSVQNYLQFLETGE